MADYYPLISKAVAGLERNTGENRRSLYERARNALVEQLRNVSPALSESDITRERLGLEEAIRKVEADVARRMREEPPRQLDRPPLRMREPLRPPAPGSSPLSRPEPRPPREPSGETAPSAPPPPSPESRPPFGRIVGRPEVTAADLRRFTRRPPLAETRPPEPRPLESRAPEPRPPQPRPPEFKPPETRPLEPRPSESRAPESKPYAEPLVSDDIRVQVPEAPEPPPAEVAPPPPPRPPAAEPIPAPPSAFEPPAEPRFAGIPGIAPRKRPEPRPAAKAEPVDDDLDREPDIPDEEEAPYRNLAGARSLEPPLMMEGPRGLPPPRRAAVEEKIEKGRVSRFLSSSVGTVLIGILVIAVIGGALFWQRNAIKAGFVGIMTLARGTGTPAARDNNAAPSRSKIPDRIGQAGQPQPDRAPGQGQAPATSQYAVLYEDDSNGKNFEGTVAWSLENIAAGPGQPMDKAIRGDIVIPERNMTVTFTIRRNTDKDLPASHTIAIMFTLPADFAHGGIQEIRGLLMKQSEQTRGVTLAGLAVKVTTGYFLIGLSASEGDVQRNIQMLKERGWFDIAIVYNDNRRAILAVEKGPQGERVFNEAFAAWGQ